MCESCLIKKFKRFSKRRRCVAAVVIQPRSINCWAFRSPSKSHPRWVASPTIYVLSCRAIKEINVLASLSPRKNKFSLFMARDLDESKRQFALFCCVWRDTLFSWLTAIKKRVTETTFKSTRKFAFSSATCSVCCHRSFYKVTFERAPRSRKRADNTSINLLERQY